MKRRKENNHKGLLRVLLLCPKTGAKEAHMKYFRLPMNLQTFAEPGGGQQPPQIDYDKIQRMLDGALATKEDSALKAYFKQQGLSQQEAERLRRRRRRASWT